MSGTVFRGWAVGFVLVVVGLAAGAQDAAPVVIPAADLSKAFATDPAGAKKKYHDKAVRVDGVVVKAGTADLMTTVVLQGAAKKGGGKHILECQFEFTAKDEVGRLKAGDKVKIDGHCIAPPNDNPDRLQLITCKLVK